MKKLLIVTILWLATICSYAQIKTCEIKASINVSPTSSNIKVTCDTTQNLIFTISDVYQNEVCRFSYTVYPGEEMLHIDLTNFKKGIYFVKIYNDINFIRFKMNCN